MLRQRKLRREYELHQQSARKAMATPGLSRVLEAVATFNKARIRACRPHPEVLGCYRCTGLMDFENRELFASS